MRFSKNMIPWLAVAAACSAFAAKPVPAGDPAPLPPIPATPAAPVTPRATDPDLLQLDKPVPRPETPPSLLPDDIPAAMPRPSPARPPAGERPGPVPKQQAAAAELDLRIRYRKARNVADANEKVRAAWEDSRDAKTDHAKRQALKRYYDLLFARMLSVDRGIAPLVKQRRDAETAALTQTQVAPTVPIE